MNGTGEVNLLAHVLVPVAHAKDAQLTSAALEPYAPDEITTLHVVEKGGGAPDKTPVTQSDEVAEEAFTAVRQVFPEANERKTYERDVANAILTAAEEIGASAIAFRARSGHRLLQFLSGDISLQLVTGADRPVIALPQVNTDE